MHTTLASDFVDNYDGSSYGIHLSWDPVDMATGYRILVYRTGPGFNYDVGVDVLANSYIDTGVPNNYKPSAAITTSNGIFDQNQSQQLYTVNLSWNPVPGADGYRVIASNQNNNIGGESAYFGSLSENYDAGYDTTDTSLIDDACYTVCFNRNKSDVSNNSGYSNLAILNGTFQISGPLVISKNGYINWGATAGTDGYGIRDNNGVMEYKDVGGSWTAISGASAVSTSGLSLSSGGSLVVNGISGSSPLRSILIGDSAGEGITNGVDNAFNIFLGSHAGFRSYAVGNSIFIGTNAGISSVYAANSIFIGTNAGNTDSIDYIHSNSSGSSILIGQSTSTGGYSNSIAIGKLAQNTTTNQFMVGSDNYPINQFVINDRNFNGGFGMMGYINFTSIYGNQTGADGYGIRDRGGILEYKNNGGSWTAFGGGVSLDVNGSFILGGDQQVYRIQTF